MTTDPIILALSEQVGCYRRLAKLAEIQHDFVQNGQTEELIGVLQSRQRLIEQLAGLDQTIAPARQRWAEYLNALEAPDQKQAESLWLKPRRCSAASRRATATT